VREAMTVVFPLQEGQGEGIVEPTPLQRAHRTTWLNRPKMLCSMRLTRPVP